MSLIEQINALKEKVEQLEKDKTFYKAKATETGIVLTSTREEYLTRINKLREERDQLQKQNDSQVDQIHRLEEEICSLEERLDDIESSSNAPRVYRDWANPSLEEVAEYVKQLSHQACINESSGKMHVRDQLFSNSALYNLVRADARSMLELARSKTVKQETDNGQGGSLPC